MAANLLEAMQGSMGSALLGEASKYLGESETVTKSALGAAMPALLAGLMQQSGTASGATQLFRTLTGPQTNTDLLGNLGGWLSGGSRTAGVVAQGESMLSSLFGERTGALANAVGAISGMKLSSVTTLLAVAAPALLAFLKSYVIGNKLDAGGLASLLAGQGEHLRNRLDDRAAGALGFGSAATFLSSLTSGVTGQAAAAAGRVTDAARDVTSGTARAAGTTYAAASGMVDSVSAPFFRRPWFWGAVVAAALVAWIFFQNWTTSVEQSARSAATQVAMAVKSLDLPDGAKINVSSGGFLDSLTSFLAGKDPALGKSFTFDELQFETGSATLTNTSSAQLTALAAVLKAYPSVAVSVGGHTDNTGDAAANKRLSAERAAAVKQALLGGGIAAARITDEGYGPEKPIASNDTEEGRAKNRRVELVVMRR